MSGITPREAAVLAMWDGGMSIEHIARHMGVARKTIARTVTYYEGNEEALSARTSMSIGSQALKAAIDAARAQGQGLAA